jgi:hypothetical protein
MSFGYDKVGCVVTYLPSGESAGTIVSYDPNAGKFILDKLISDGSRYAFVRLENEGKKWQFYNDRLALVIHPGYGGFSIQDENGETYATTDRHNPRLVEKALSLIEGHRSKYRIVYIPSYMVGHYHIAEYDGAESVELLVDKYKIDAIAIIRKGFKNASTQLEEIDRILAMEIEIL